MIWKRYKLLFLGYTNWRSDVYFPIGLLYAMSIAGWVCACRRRFDLGFAALVFLFALSNVVSASLIYISDGWRVFMISYPLLAALIAGGMVSLQTVQTWHVARRYRPAHIAAAMAIATVIVVFGPLALIAVRSDKDSSPIAAASPGEVIISRQRPLTGFMVVADSAEPLRTVPSIAFSKFREFLEAGQFLQATPMERFPPVPFGFLYPAEMPRNMRVYQSLVVPPEVILRDDVRAWRLKVAPLNDVEAWVQATQAEPIP